MFYIIFAIRLLVFHKNRMRIIAGINLLLCAWESIMDYCIITWAAEEFNGNIWHLFTIIDVISIPTCLLLVREVLHAGWTNLENVLTQFIPFILIQIVYLIFPEEEVFYAIMVYSIIYIIYHIRSIRIDVKKERKQLREQYSYIDNLNLGWTLHIAVIFGCMCALWLINSFVHSRILMVLCYWLSVVFWSLLLCLIHKQESALEMFAQYDAMEVPQVSSNSIPTLPDLDALMLEKNITYVQDLQLRNWLPKLEQIELTCLIT